MNVLSGIDFSVFLLAFCFLSSEFSSPCPFPAPDRVLSLMIEVFAFKRLATRDAALFWFISISWEKYGGNVSMAFKLETGTISFLL